MLTFPCSPHRNRDWALQSSSQTRASRRERAEDKRWQNGRHDGFHGRPEPQLAQEEGLVGELQAELRQLLQPLLRPLLVQLPLQQLLLGLLAQLEPLPLALPPLLPPLLPALLPLLLPEPLPLARLPALPEPLPAPALPAPLPPLAAPAPLPQPLLVPRQGLLQAVLLQEQVPLQGQEVLRLWENHLPRGLQELAEQVPDTVSE